MFLSREGERWGCIIAVSISQNIFIFDRNTSLFVYHEKRIAIIFCYLFHDTIVRFNCKKRDGWKKLFDFINKLMELMHCLGNGIPVRQHFNRDTS